MEIRYHTPLTPEEQIAHGLADPQPLALADKVRFAELDLQNHVNNKAYMTWFESARVGYSDRFMLPTLDQRPRFMVHSLSLRFIREMLMGEDYIVTCRVSAFRNSSYTLDQQLWSGDMRARMSVVMVMATRDGSARMEIPDELRKVFVERDGAVDER